jgi:hypothetical protein
MDDDMLWVLKEVEEELQASESNKCHETGDICSSRYNEDLCKDERLA